MCFLLCARGRSRPPLLPFTRTPVAGRGTLDRGRVGLRKPVCFSDYGTARVESGSKEKTF